MGFINVLRFKLRRSLSPSRSQSLNLFAGSSPPLSSLSCTAPPLSRKFSQKEPYNPPPLFSFCSNTNTERKTHAHPHVHRHTQYTHTHTHTHTHTCAHRHTQYTHAQAHTVHTHTHTNVTQMQYYLGMIGKGTLTTPPIKGPENFTGFLTFFKLNFPSFPSVRCPYFLL